LLQPLTMSVDVVVSRIDVRFTRESGLMHRNTRCPLWAISGFSLEAAWELHYDYLASPNRSIAK
jgi:hypothetical protein